MVRCAVLADQPAAVEAEDHREILKGYIVDDLVVGPLHECRIDVAEGDIAGSREARGKGHGMLFGDADVEGPFRHLGHHDIEGAAG